MLNVFILSHLLRYFKFVEYIAWSKFQAIVIPVPLKKTITTEKVYIFPKGNLTRYEVSEIVQSTYISVKMEKRHKYEKANV